MRARLHAWEKSNLMRFGPLAAAPIRAPLYCFSPGKHPRAAWKRPGEYYPQRVALHAAAVRLPSPRHSFAVGDVSDPFCFDFLCLYSPAPTKCPGGSGERL
eukprot:1175595-Prorocentrum_minimum.AAC.5